ncbi:ATP-dependent metallopeptidase FtsH/Yme1/Tma family protein, partial [Chloroflexota bacterium]
MNWKRSGLIYIVILVTVVAIATVLFSAPQMPEEKSLREAITMSQNGEIKEIVEEGEWLTVVTADGTELKTNIGVLNYNDLRELGLNTDVKYEIKPGSFNWGNMLISFLPLLLFGGLLF